MKNGTYKDNIGSATYIEDKRLKEEASSQIKKSLLYIDRNWNNVSRRLSITASQSEIEIVPLIVSNLFEGDLKTYKGCVKISLFELSIIAKNDKSSIYPAMKIVQRANPLNPYFKEGEDISSPDLDLWEGKKELDVKTLIKKREMLFGIYLKKEETILNQFSFR